MIFISAVNSNLHLPFQFHIFQSHCLTHDSDLSEKHELFPPTTRQLDTSALNGTDTSTANCQPPERINQPSAENGIIRNGKYAHCIDRIFVLFAMCVCVYSIPHVYIASTYLHYMLPGRVSRAKKVSAPLFVQPGLLLAAADGTIIGTRRTLHVPVIRI